MVDICPRHKRQKTNFKLKVNDVYTEHKNELSAAFCNGKAIKLDNSAEVITDPFTCCVLPNFIEPDYYLKDLKDELGQMEMSERINDLYQYQQTKDLMYYSLPHLSDFRDFLQESILPWMKTVTKIPLTDKVDVACSCYTHTDHLLCHDDELEDRRIAFIFYLVPQDWNDTDGGSLDLFKTVDGLPTETTRSVFPKLNSFVFFEVSPVSYHQVSEVLSSKKRLALSGWFHGPTVKRCCPVDETILLEEISVNEIDIREWINPAYLEGETHLQIREQFEETSEISLPDFFIADKYKEVCKALSDDKLQWDKKGPANRRLVYEANSEKMSPILRECQALFSSEAFLVILSNLTSLKLHPMCGQNIKLGKVATNVRKWCPGSYTLLHDKLFYQSSSLNVFMHFSCSEWNSECGGYKSFITIDEYDEALRVEPTSNSISLVYITEGTAHFVKYINSKSKKQPSCLFYDMYSIYKEDDDNEDSDEDSNESDEE